MPQLTMWNDYKESTEIMNLELAKLSNNIITDNKSTWDKAGNSVQLNQDYNGVKIDSTNGITIVSSKNILTLAASKGIEFKKKDTNEILMSADVNGDLVIKGNIQMTGGSILWNKVTAPDYTNITGSKPPADATNTWTVLTGDDRVKGIFFTKDGKLAIRADALRIDNTTQFESGYNPKEIKDKVDNMSIGGRNILFNSGDFVNTKYWELNSGTSIEVVDKDGAKAIKGIGSYKQWSHVLYKLKPSTEYIFSAEVMFSKDMPVNESAPLHCWTRNGENVHSAGKWLLSKTTATANTWEKIVLRIKTVATGETEFTPFIYHQDLNTLNVTSYLRNMKLEEGNTVTAWQPNPADMYTRMDDIQVGGRNLIARTGFVKGTSEWNWNNAKTVVVSNEPSAISGKAMVVTMDGTISGGVHKPSTMPLRNGETYTWSIYIKASRNCTITIGSEDGGQSANGVTTSWQKFTYTFKANTSGTYHSNVIYYQKDGTATTFYFHSFKLEAGSKATDWTEAPEDTTSAINDSTQVSKDYADSQLNAMVIGGRNIVRNSAFLDGTMAEWAKWGLPTQLWVDTQGTIQDSPRCISMEINAANQGVMQSVKVTPGVVHTLSAWVWVKPGSTIKPVIMLNNNNAYATAFATKENQWEKVVLTYTPTVANETIYLGRSGAAGTGTYSFVSIQLEEGNKASSWSPNPEDTVQALEKYKSTVTQQFQAYDGKFESTITETQKIVNTGRIYLRGTGQNRPAGRLVVLNNKDVTPNNGRGHCLMTLRRSDLAVTFTQTYDTHGTVADRDAMADKLNSLKDDVIVLVTTQDSAYTHQKLSDALARCGGSGKIINDQRYPQALIGIPGIGRGNGIESIMPNTTDAPYAEVSSLIQNGIPQGINSPLSTMATEMQTSIEQTSNRIGLIVKQSGGKDVVDGTTLVSAINLTPEAIKIEAKNINFQGDVSFNNYISDKAKTEIANTQFGGTNLINNSDYFRAKELWANSGIADAVLGSDSQYGRFVTLSSSGATTNVWKGMSQDLKAQAGIQEFYKGEFITVSFWYKINTTLDEGMGIEIKGINPNGSNVNSFPFKYITKDTPTGKWMKYVGTAACGDVTLKNPYFYIWITKNGSISVAKIKVERGNVATEWSPSPADTQYLIDNVNVGGRNLIRNSSNPINTKDWTHAGTLSVDNSDYWRENIFTIRNTVVAEKTASSTRVRVNPDSEYTLSAMVWLDGNTTTDMYFLGRNFDSTKEFDFVHEYAPRNLPAKTWTRLVYTFRTNANEREGYVRFDNNGFAGASAVSFRQVKLEAGNRATDWSPAPEDATDAIVDVATSLNNRGSAWDTARDLVNVWKGNAIGGTTYIKGGLIETNTITADKIAISDFTNYATNPQFADGTAIGWTANVVAVQNTLGGPTKYLGRTQIRDTYCENWFTVQPGDKFFVSADVYTTDSTLPIGIGMNFTSTDGSNPNWKVITQAPTGGKWIRVSGEISLGTSEIQTRARAFVQIGGTANFGNWYFTNVEVRRKNGGELIVDGSIKTTHIAVNAINATHIQSNAINASHIQSGTITTNELSVLAKDLVNNFSNTGTLEGYSLGNGGTMSLVNDPKGQYGKVLKMTTGSDLQIYSSLFEVNTSKTYRVKVSAYMPNTTPTARIYFGVMAYNANKQAIGMKWFNYSNRNFEGGFGSTNPYFLVGAAGAKYDNWRDMESLLLPATSTDPDLIGRGLNTDTAYAMHPDTRYVAIRFFHHYSNTATIDSYWAHPSVTDVDSGIFTFDQAQGGTLKLGTSTGNGFLQVVKKSGNGQTETVGQIDETGAYFPRIQADVIVGGVVGTDKTVGQIFFDSINGNDNNSGTRGAPKRNIQAFIDQMGKFISNKIELIQLNGNIDSPIFINGFMGPGAITVRSDDSGARKTINSGIVVNGVMCQLYIAHFIMQAQDRTMAETGTDSLINVTASPNVDIWYCKLYGNKKVEMGITGVRWAYIRAVSIEIYDVKSRAFSIIYNANAYIKDCKGGRNPISILVSDFAVVQGEGTRPDGSVTRWANAYVGGYMGDGLSWRNDIWTVDYGEATPPPPPPPSEYVREWSSQGGQNWSANGYWDDEIYVKQGTWGYGNRTGTWWFSSDLANTLRGKTIIDAQLYITRYSKGGNSGAREARIVAHQYADRRPDNNPPVSSEYVTDWFSWGEGKWVNVTGFVQNKIANGVDRGFGLKFDGSSANYMAFLPDAKLWVKYK
ncbi:tail fiber domain-containing protein_gp073 [Bacillus phage vB_BceM_WH1]|nr:tail fiber domain-containing protein_gp073 [Bacillus phage vB_BceM_WH1]